MPRSVRARATFAATAVVALALGGTALALLAVLQANLTRDVRATAVRQADRVVELAGREHLPQIIVGYVDGPVRVVDSTGQLVATTPDLLPGEDPESLAPGWRVQPGLTVGTGRMVPLPPKVPRPPGAGDPSTGYPSTDEMDNLLDAKGNYYAKQGFKRSYAGQLVTDSRRQVVSMTVNGPDGELTVYSAASLRPVEAAGRTATAALAVGLPLLVALVAMVTWRVTGRALRPVEAIRSEVAEITGHDLHRRVPVPRTGDEVSRLAATVNSTLDRLEDAGQRQRRFIADASHELRSPIAVLRTQLEVALAHPDPELWPDLLADALQDTVRLQDLATDLLLLARLDAADPVATRIVDLDVLVADVLDARVADRVPVAAQLADGVRVSGNITWLTRLLTNLVDNAQRYAEGRVEVRLAAEEGEAVLEVRDDGPGIPEPDRERVFERFTRLDDARSRELGGAGLGLAIARDLAEHHGGTLYVAGQPEDGEHPGDERPCGARLVARIPLAEPPRQGS
nr:HAMP domain-containing sensor histidine kinase [Kitasatospora sp. SID7827]